MSQKNHPETKELRCQARQQRDTVREMSATRRALSHIPHDVAVRVLSDPKGKLTRKKRARFSRALQSAFLLPTTEARDIAVKVCVKLRHLPLVGVIRLLKKSARRASTVKHLLEKLDANSQFRAPLQAQQDHFLAVLKQARAEYQVRTQTKTPISA